MGIAIANNLLEVWICKPFVLQLAYLNIYYPNVGRWYVYILYRTLLNCRYFIKLFHFRITKKMGTKFLQYLRDNEVTIKTNTKEKQ